MLTEFMQSSLLFGLVFCTLVANAQLVETTSKDNSAQCQCYLTSGPDPGYFQYHRFWDFRTISNDGHNDFTAAPPLVTASENDGDESITSSYFNTSRFLADWDIQTGQQGRDGALPTYNSAQNIYISRNVTDGANNSTYLTLRAHRLADFMSITEIDSNQRNLLHSSIRVCARLIPNGLSNSSAPSAGATVLNDAQSGSNTSHPIDGGAVWGFFTYRNDQQESDIEILTNDDISQVHYTNQPDYIAKTDTTIDGASTQLTLPEGLVWTEWIEHRIDWFNGIARWYVNGILVLNKTKNAETDPSGLIINLWGDGGDWSGNMSVGGQVTVGIEWIDMVFNVSGSVDGGDSRKRDETGSLEMRASKCESRCNVDGIESIGFPEMLNNASSSTASFIKQSSGEYAARHAMAILVLIQALLA